MPTTKSDLNIVLAILIALVVWMVFPYLSAIGWAVIAAIVIYPLFIKLHTLMPWRRHTVALLTTTLFLLIIIIPLAFIVVSGVEEARVVASHFNFASFQHTLALSLNKIPVAGHYLAAKLQQIDWQTLLSHAKTAKWTQLLPLVREVGSSLPTFLINLVLFCALLHTFLVSTEPLQTMLKHQFPKALPSNWLQDVSGMTRAICFALLATGLLVLVVMMTTYFVIGLPAPIFLGCLTAMISLIPFLLPIFYLVSAALMLLFSFALWKVVLFLVIGLGLNFITDNILQPKLLHNKTRLNFAASLLGILGGIYAFGIIGLFIGPVLLNLMIQMLQARSLKITPPLHD